LPIA
jgi:hypothetical protein